MTKKLRYMPKASDQPQAAVGIHLRRIYGGWIEHFVK